MSTPRNWYRIVKAFWVDSLNEMKRIIRTHGKAIKVLFISLGVAFLVVLGAAFKISETSTFCGSCHQMTGYIESWKASSHRHVACTTTMRPVTSNEIAVQHASGVPQKWN